MKRYNHVKNVYLKLTCLKVRYKMAEDLGLYNQYTIDQNVNYLVFGSNTYILYERVM